MLPAARKKRKKNGGFLIQLNRLKSDLVANIKVTMLIMSLIQLSLFCDTAKGAFCINAFLNAAGWPRLADS